MPAIRQIAKRLLVTPGEPGGIGGEILIDAAHQSAQRGGSALITIDDPNRLTTLAKAKSVALNITPVDSVEAANDLPPETLPVLPITWPEAPQPGQASVANAPQVIDAITQAARFAQDGLVKGIVTNPIQKSSLYAAGFTLSLIHI